MPPLLRLRDARRRLIVQRALEGAVASAIGASVLLLGIGAAGLGRGPFAAVAAAFAVIALGTAGRAWLGRPTLAQTAALLDRRAATRDRFQTALDFRQRPAPTPLEALALEDCARFARAFSVRRWLPLRLPRLAPGLLPPLAGLALLAWGVFSPRPHPPTALDATLAQRAADWQKIAATLRQGDPNNPEAARLADAAEQSAQRLQAGGLANDSEKRKAALREISALEARVNALKAARDQPVSPGELAALAAALAADRPVADALRAGQLGAAASHLERLLQSLRDRGDAGTAALEQLARSLQEQAAKLTDPEKNEIARQMQAAGQGAQAGQPALSQQALARLAQLLRQAGQNGAPATAQAAGPAMTERELQSLLEAMENMKRSLRPGENPGGDVALSLVGAFAPKADPPAWQAPSGQPGGEHDAGHVDALAGAAPGPLVTPQGPATRLAGVQGEGDALQQFLGAASDGSRTTRAYREGFERLVPAAQNAVEQENIPLGSRGMVRRYFENIRPKE